MLLPRQFSSVVRKDANLCRSNSLDSRARNEAEIRCQNFVGKGRPSHIPHYRADYSRCYIRRNVTLIVFWTFFLLLRPYSPCYAYKFQTFCPHVMYFLCYKHSIPMLYCYAYLRLSSSYAYYIWAKSPSVMAIPLVTSNIASRVISVIKQMRTKQ